MPLPNTSPVMSPMPTDGESCDCGRARFAEVSFTASQAPRAVIPVPLWS